MKPELIKQLELELNFTFEKVDISIIRIDKWEKTCQYSIDSEGNITGLCLASSNLDRFPATIKNDVIKGHQFLSYLKSLNLHNNQISHISSLRGFTRLETLNLYNNLISNISDLKELENLISLNLYSNQISDISALKGLVKLKYLSIGDNRISDISALKNLSNIIDLVISKNKISDISPLSKMKKLIELRFRNNNVSDISILSGFNNLEDLSIASNNISDISSLAGLKNLTVINLGKNQVSNISPLKELKNLTGLSLKKNPIKLLPEWICDFPNMDIQWRYNIIRHGFITFHENSIQSPPIEIVKLGKQAIKDWYIALKKEKGEQEYLFESKLLIIGEGGTGKTTFARKMQNLNADMPDDDETTLGIEVSKWIFDRQDGSDKQDGKFNVNLWDFGGQKIYQGTHQIFFSEKSLYVLVAETREQNTDFSYWLNTVEQLAGDDSHLIIVLNKKHGHIQKIDESGYKSRFGKIIKQVFELDLKNDIEEIAKLQSGVKHWLTQLPGIGDALPPAWVRIREDLLSETCNFISFERFREICKEHNTTEASVIYTLSGYFNRIGVITHYIDDPILQERIYLNSNWLVKTVYKILDNETIKQNKGRLTEKEINTIWQNNELKYEIHQLTQLMHKFGLMYHIPNSKEFVVPEHLPSEMPYENWEYSDNPDILQFLYEFDKYMPKGLMSRLTVNLNKFINNQDNVWHRGVNIEKDGAFAEIVETYGSKNTFHIRLAGKNKKELLTIIVDRFDEILSPYIGLQYEKLVPCICNICKSIKTPHFFKFSELKDRKGTGKQTIECGLKPFDAVDVNRVLNGVTNINKLILHENQDEVIDSKRVIELNNKQRKEFRKALSAAYPDYDDLKIFMSEEFDVELNEIVSKSNDMKNVTFELIKWAKANGKTPELIENANNDSDNPLMKEFYKNVMQ